jgi:hypothetical protein
MNSRIVLTLVALTAITAASSAAVTIDTNITQLETGTSTFTATGGSDAILVVATGCRVNDGSYTYDFGPAVSYDNAGTDTDLSIASSAFYDDPNSGSYSSISSIYYIALGTVAANATFDVTVDYSAIGENGVDSYITMLYGVDQSNTVGDAVGDGSTSGMTVDFQFTTTLTDGAMYLTNGNGNWSGSTTVTGTNLSSVADASSNNSSSSFGYAPVDTSSYNQYDINWTSTAGQRMSATAAEFNPVPEPMTIALLGLGGAGLLARRRRRA